VREEEFLPARGPADSPGFFVFQAESYLWEPGGETTRQIEVDPVASTHYSVMAWDANGCAAESAEHAVDVTFCVPEVFSDDFETGDTNRWSHAAF
jgi:hypothetical protein